MRLPNIKGRATVLFGGQYGSEAKGSVAAWLARDNQFSIAVTNAGAQSGHTVYINGHKKVGYHIPSTVIVNPEATAYINAGAIIDPDMLLAEIEEFRPRELFIHPKAAIIQPHHKAEAKRGNSTTKIGSTQKGVGQALASKVLREGNLAGNEPRLKHWIKHFNLIQALDLGRSAIIEVPQGFSLSLDWGLGLHTTSRNCWVMSGLEAAGLHAHYLGASIMVIRTFPIRVGNITTGIAGHDDKQYLIGYSGGGYPDQCEIQFEDIGQPAEYTTVTGRKRRLFTFSAMQYEKALRYNRPDVVVCTFMNYLHDVSAFIAKLNEVELRVGWMPKRVYQWGDEQFTENL